MPITDNERQNSNSWHLDKRIPITLVILIVMQTAVGIWWASTMDSRVKELEKDAVNYVTMQTCLDKHSILEHQVRYVETLNAKVAQRLENIDKKLDRLIETVLTATNGR